MYTIKEIKPKVDAIWQQANAANLPFVDRGYRLPSSIINNSIMFVGINPSYSGKYQHDEAYQDEFYHVDQEGKHHPYFNKFPILAADSGLQWSHLDLLYYRETKQTSFHEYMETMAGKQFISAQLDLSKEIITKTKPKVIVVCNTLARKLIIDHFDWDLSWDDALGTYVISKIELSGVPIFFSSMLTGQRALDNGSFDRLKWQINRCVR